MNETIEKPKSPSPDIFEHFYRHHYGVVAGYLPKDTALLSAWVSNIVEISQSANNRARFGQLQPSIAAMMDMLERDRELRELVEAMIHEGEAVHLEYEPEAEYRINSIATMLEAMNYIIQNAPPFSPQTPHSAFPMSGLFVYMMWTPAGMIVFRNELFNRHLAAILQAWCDFLDSPASLHVITTKPDGWLCEASYLKNDLDQFVTEAQQQADPRHWGYLSFNDFFHREIIKICRPVDGLTSQIEHGQVVTIDNPKVITSANDGTVYRIAHNVKREDCFDCKSQNYSLQHMLDDSQYTDKFVGGDVVQTFLSGNNYHRWWAPISGTVVEQRVVPGYMFSELYTEGFDPSAGTRSQAYEANVNTRGLVFIESDDPAIGIVCVIPIGITEISSINIQVQAGDRVEKGQELGWFSYGGSSMCLVFQKGAIKQFTIVNPLASVDSDDGPYLRVGSQIAIANTSQTQ